MRLVFAGLVLGAIATPGLCRAETTVGVELGANINTYSFSPVFQNPYQGTSSSRTGLLANSRGIQLSGGIRFPVF